MQHLLDFIQEHSLEEQLYFAVPSATGDLELLWRRDVAADHWQLRLRGVAGPGQLVERGTLIQTLQSRGADMGAVKRELNAMLAAQIAFADMVLRDANQQLGRDLVQRYVRGHQGFITELQAAIEKVTQPPRPAMKVVDGGGAQTELRAGHLTIVRGS
jgi:hypothetical protein